MLWTRWHREDALRQALAELDQMADLDLDALTGEQLGTLKQPNICLLPLPQSRTRHVR